MANLHEHLTAADSVLDLARHLGLACIKKEGELQETRRKGRQKVLLESLETRVAASSPSAWTGAVVDGPEKLASHVGQEIVDLLDQADTFYPLDCLGVLRGLLRGPLVRLFDAFEGRVILDDGMPVPFATRPINEIIEPKPTPFQPTLSSSELLDECGARFFEYSAEAQVQICLDFSQRDEIDHLVWDADKRLPKIASIHPPRCGDLKGAPIGDRRFFDAGPRHWNLAQVLALLKAAAEEAEIAVLPELSLENPRVLEDELKQAPDGFPSLIIAGSSHVRLSNGAGEEIRANEGKIYLQGQEIGAYRKNNAYEAKRLNGEDLTEPLLEGLTPEKKIITVLSGAKTRLAVVICADINHLTNPGKLLAACVNLLFVPSFTPEPGSFNGPIADLAARCQAVSVIPNAPPDDAATPFHLMAGVPRQTPAEQTMMYPRNGEKTSHLAIFDPNEPLDQALEWR